jgi:hypothetical protein
MYCPNCGQQQISEEMRFCSRCGLALSGLPEWLAGGGLPAKGEAQAGVEPSSPRRKGMRRAAKLMFISGVLLPVFIVFSLVFDEGALIIVPILVFFVALVLMLYARLFSATTAPVSNQAAQTSALGGSTSARGSLPPAANIPMTGVGSQHVRTNELVQPSSVTEHTTRLLDNE